MKITDEMINRYAEKYCNKYGAIKLIITSEEVAYHFFREQETEDIPGRQLAKFRMWEILQGKISFFNKLQEKKGKFIWGY